MNRKLLMKHFIALAGLLVNTLTFSQVLPNKLHVKLDSIITIGIDSLAYPGAQVLVRHKDDIIYHHTWGYHTYDNKRPILKDDIYDLASISKVSTGLPVLMQLHGKGLIDLDAPISDYIKSLKRGDKKNLTFRQILTHQARLKPYIVFWVNALKKNGKYKAKSFKSVYSKNYPIKITDNLYLHKNYKNKMEKAIRKSSLRDETEYLYSGLIFLLLPDMIEDLVKVPFKEYLYKNIYDPIGATTLRYNPLQEILLERIVPTERDTFWRKQLVHGTVHDEAAAMLGGISCNAGLFGNAEDLSKLFQLYLNNGEWYGEQIVNAQSINIFTSYHYVNNRRGLGFDKPPHQYEVGESYIAESASPSSFGHSGFTGTLVWADPEEELIVVFLSNRVYPSRSQRNLYELNIRPRLHQAIYDYINGEK